MGAVLTHAATRLVRWDAPTRRRPCSWPAPAKKKGGVVLASPSERVSLPSASRRPPCMRYSLTEPVPPGVQYRDEAVVRSDRHRERTAARDLLVEAKVGAVDVQDRHGVACLLYTSPSPR